jgi:hypothetical protein
MRSREVVSEYQSKWVSWNIAFWTVLLTSLLSGCGSRIRTLSSSQPNATSPLSITTQTLPFATAGNSYKVSLIANGGVPPYSWSISLGALPGGLSLGKNTGTLSGVTEDFGSFAFRATVTDSQGTVSSAGAANTSTTSSGSTTASASLTLKVLDDANASQPITISTAALPSAVDGIPYSFTLAATGGVPPYSWEISSGSLPAGFMLTAASGIITGITNQAGVFTFQADVIDSSGTGAAGAFSLAAIAGSSRTGPVGSAELFGLHIQSLASPWPAIGFGAVRMWSNINGARWGQINKANGVYDFSTLDAFLSEFYTNGVTDVLYTIGQVPRWASTNPTDTACDFAKSRYSTGGCDLPGDINLDGSGTDQTYINFIAAIARHVNDPTYLQTHAHIKYWEPWNEWFRNSVVSTYSWNHYSIHASYAQMVRMVEDVRCTVTGVGSVNGNACAATPIDRSALIVSPSSGGYDCCFAPQVFQNFLYCNGTGDNAPIPGSECTTGDAGSAAVDIICSHWYEGKGRMPEDLLTDVPVFTSLLSPADLAKPLWSGEGSWSSDAFIPDEDEQASWVARYYLAGWSTKASRFYWYAYDSIHYGSLEIPGALNLAGQAYGATYQWIVGSTLTAPCANNGGTIWTCGLTRNSGYQAIAVWDTSQSCSNGVCTTSTYSVPSGMIQYSNLSGGTVSLNGAATVQIGLLPILLENEDIPEAPATPFS